MTAHVISDVVHYVVNRYPGRDAAVVRFQLKGQEVDSKQFIFAF